MKALEITGIILAVLALLIIVKIIMAIPKLISLFIKEYFLAVMWRHFTGAHYHGNRVTDATWFRKANNTKRHQFERGTFMDRWEHKPRAHRMLWRWGCTLAFFILVYGMLADFWVAVHAAESVLVYLIVVTGFVIESKWRLRHHNRQLDATADSLADYLGLSPQAIRSGLHIEPQNIKDEGEIGYWEMPPELTPSEDKQSGITRIVNAHLPVDIEMEFKTKQSPKIATIVGARKPPPLVVWDETVDAMENAAYGDIVIGKDKYKNIFTLNFIDSEDPHWGFSVNTKRGKSNFLGLVAVQVLHQDPQAQVIAIDPKQESLIDYLGSPSYIPGIPNGLKPLLKGVTLDADPAHPEAMWASIARAKKLMETRGDEYAQDRSRKFPLCLVLIDELEKFQRITKKAWDAKRAEDKKLPRDMREDLPARCPVWDDILDLLHMGQFVGVRVVTATQDFRERILGQGARNAFGVRGMAGYLPNQWNYFIGTPPVPPSQNGVGRWIFTQGESRDWVQITYVDHEKAYAWAAQGRELHVPDVPEEPDTREDAKILSLVVNDPGDDIITTIAGADEYFGWNQGRFEKARLRTKGGIPGEFKVNGKLAWRKKDLDKWERNRPGNKRRENQSAVEDDAG